MTKGRRSYSYTYSDGFLSQLYFLYPPFPLLSLRLTSLPSWQARCRPTLPSDASPLPLALPSALIGWRVAANVAVSVAVCPHWLVRCRQMRHRCRLRSLDPTSDTRITTLSRISNLTWSSKATAPTGSTPVTIPVRRQRNGTWTKQCNERNGLRNK